MQTRNLDDVIQEQRNTNRDGQPAGFAAAVAAQTLPTNHDRDPVAVRVTMTRAGRASAVDVMVPECCSERFAQQISAQNGNSERIAEGAELAAGVVYEPLPMAEAMRALADLRARTAEVAMQYARRHGWCDTVKDALGELNIEPPIQRCLRIVLDLTAFVDGAGRYFDLAEARNDYQVRRRFTLALQSRGITLPVERITTMEYVAVPDEEDDDD